MKLHPDRAAGAGFAALLLALPVPASAQQATWAQDGRESFCIYDGIMASAGGGGMDAARLQAIQGECRQRFGWTDSEAGWAALVGQATLKLRLANADAAQAEVDRAVIDAVFATFSNEDVVDLALDGLELSEGSRAIATRAATGVAERGLSGDAATMAARVVVLRLIAARVAAEFAVERGLRDGR